MRADIEAERGRLRTGIVGSADEALGLVVVAVAVVDVAVAGAAGARVAGGAGLGIAIRDEEQGAGARGGIRRGGGRGGHGVEKQRLAHGPKAITCGGDPAECRDRGEG